MSEIISTIFDSVAIGCATFTMSDGSTRRPLMDRCPELRPKYVRLAKEVEEMRGVAKA